MNDRLQAHARNLFKIDLLKYHKDQQHKFKLMYAKSANCDLEATVETIIDNMPEDKLDWAMSQVENTLRKNKRKEI